MEKDNLKNLFQNFKNGQEQPIWTRHDKSSSLRLHKKQKKYQH